MVRLDQALDFLSLGMWTERSLDYAEIGARGVLITGDYGAHVLVLIDGHALNEQWDGSTYFDRAAAVPFEIVDRIEVVLGPGSVLYGSNAMLGVLNIIPKRGRELPGISVILESEVPASMRAATAIGREFSLFGEATEVVGQAEIYVSEGPAATLGPQDYGPDAVTGEPRRFTAVTAEPLKKKKGRQEFKRGILTFRDKEWRVQTTGPQGSGILTSMVLANCFIILEEDRGDVSAGETVWVEPFQF